MNIIKYSYGKFNKVFTNIINDNNNNLNEDNIIEQFKGKSQPTIKKL